MTAVAAIEVIVFGALGLYGATKIGLLVW